MSGKVKRHTLKIRNLKLQQPATDREYRELLEKSFLGTPLIVAELFKHFKNLSAEINIKNTEDLDHAPVE